MAKTLVDALATTIASGLASLDPDRPEMRTTQMDAADLADALEVKVDRPLSAEDVIHAWSDAWARALREQPPAARDRLAWTDNQPRRPWDMTFLFGYLEPERPV